MKRQLNILFTSLTGGAVLGAAALFAQQTAAPPPQPSADPFLWLEEVDEAKAMAWVNAKNAATLAELTKLPLYTPVFERAKKIMDSKDRIAVPQILGDRIYNFWQDDVHERGIWRRTSLKDY